jgi:hypothetical protein
MCEEQLKGHAQGSFVRIILVLGNTAVLIYMCEKMGFWAAYMA